MTTDADAPRGDTLPAEHFASLARLEDPRRL